MDKSKSQLLELNTETHFYSIIGDGQRKRNVQSHGNTLHNVLKSVNVLVFAKKIIDIIIFDICI